MANRRVADNAKRVVVSARIAPGEKIALLTLGEGDISKGIERVLDARRKALISARLLPAEKEELTTLGEGCINRGLDRVMEQMRAGWKCCPDTPEATPPAA